MLPVEGITPVLLSSLAVAIKISLASLYHRLGLASSISATTPAVAGLLILVPLSLENGYDFPLKVVVSSIVTLASVNEEILLITLTPGADTSGFNRSSTVGPKLLKLAPKPPPMTTPFRLISL